MTIQKKIQFEVLTKAVPRRQEENISYVHGKFNTVSAEPLKTSRINNLFKVYIKLQYVLSDILLYFHNAEGNSFSWYADIGKLT